MPAMSVRSRRLPSLAVMLALLVNLGPAGIAGPVRAADSPTFWFHGEIEDEANSAFTFGGRPGTAVFDETSPTDVVPVTQSTTPVANQDFVGNFLTAYWRGGYTPAAPIEGLLDLTWFWSSANPATVAGGTQVAVTIFANPDYAAASRVQPDRVIGRSVVSIAAGAAPTENRTSVPVNSRGVPVTELVVQVAAISSITGGDLKVHYDATSTPSRFVVRDVPLPPAPTLRFDTTRSLAFAPSTVVSAHFLGAEPMTAMERPLANAPGAPVDPDRVFVDWPLSTRSQIGQLSRSEDGSDSFRLIYDMTCPTRSRPMCGTGGGGDTDSEVNPFTGTVLFTDQVGLANEALASSIDHGDTFPATRSFTVTNATTVTDRQWVTAIDPSLVSVAGRRVEGFLAYHLPAAGQYIQAITEDGAPVPQAVPQILEVAQSGPIRVDNSGGPAHGWIWQPYRNGGGFKVATAPAADFADPLAWRTYHVSSDQPAIFPWFNLDDAGNAYALWVTAGVAYLAVSPIDDPRNDPRDGGRPGTYWTDKVRVTPDEIRSAVLPVVTAGASGRIGLAYVGSEDCVATGTSVSDNCPLTTTWHAYATVIEDALALARGETATAVTGRVSHRVVHRGSVCTGGTTCTGDRSLLDMIDIGLDASGRLGVVFMDNNNRLAAPNETDNAKQGPFVHFAKQVAGPSLSATTPTVAIDIPRNARSDIAGDATWPNRAGAANLPALDLRGAQLAVAGDDIIARIRVADTSVAGAQRDLIAYNGVPQAGPPAERIQHVLRFAAGFDLYHLSMETLADGTRRFFGGRIDANDGLPNPASPTAVMGVGYHTDPIAVSGTAAGGVITIRAKAADFGVAAGSELFSVTGFAFAGPTEANELTAATPMRTVDASPPFDATLAELPVEVVAVDCADPGVVRSGGWAVLEDARAGEGTLCRTHTKSDGGAPYMELAFDGTAVDVVVAKGPRGGLIDLSLDGGAPMRVDLYRAPTDPTKPDNSGRKDLDFGVTIHLEAGSGGPHTLRITGVPPADKSKRDMAYVDGFLVTGRALPPPPGSPSETSVVATGTLTSGLQQLFDATATAATTQLTFIVETAPGATVTVVDPASGTALATANADDGVAVLRLTPNGPASYAVVVSASPKSAWAVWAVTGKNR